ncbi:hypothetical protein ACBJ59_48525 [Nonomuraea sp. MTCD27]|uniref:hypothetical protein n=1 Tax=Nonomuraea sp. MTCD27 TaxID=1676747 RepID=UPI0035BF441C
MLRYRLGLIVVAVFAVLVGASGVVALVTGDIRLSQLLVYWGSTVWRQEPRMDVIVMLILVGMLHAWALWQFLPKRQDGGKPDREAWLLRIALYAWAVIELADRMPWTDVPEEIVQVAVVVLLYRAMRGVSRTLRLFALVAGLHQPGLAVAYTVLDSIGINGGFLQDALPLGTMPWLVWIVLTLVAQAKDGRWRRGTLWAGVAAAVGPGLVSQLAGPFYSTFVWHEGLGLAIGVVTSVWLARTAREVGNRPRSPRPTTAGSPLRWWPVQVVAVVLPLLPAVVNSANGMFTWIGSRGAIASWFTGSGWFLWQLWFSFDLLVGIGGASGLVLAAVLVRTMRLVLGTIWALLVAAVAGVVSVATAEGEGMTAAPAGYELVEGYDSVRMSPDQLLGSEVGISPLWYSAALTGSALLLLLVGNGRLAYGNRLGYGGGRRPYQAVMASVSTALVLVLVPVSDHAPGPITTASDCEAMDGRKSPKTGEQKFVCMVRRSSLPFGKALPDPQLIAYGRRMCGIYTRGDAREAAAFREAHGIDPLQEAGLLYGVCPKADADTDKAAAEEEAEMLAWEAEEQAKCDHAPRHRPLIKPVRAVRQKRPVWPETVLEAYEGEGMPDYGLVGRGSELVTAAPGHLRIEVDTTYRVCVTTETYTRRPPVEVKGWDRVVEVGYESPTGRIVLSDGLVGVELPDLAVRGAGHYRIRVHYAWLDWKGHENVGQRLLVMAWPGRGDDVVVHHPAHTQE